MPLGLLTLEDMGHNDYGSGIQDLRIYRFSFLSSVFQKHLFSCWGGKRAVRDKELKWQVGNLSATLGCINYSCKVRELNEPFPIQDAMI